MSKLFLVTNEGETGDSLFIYDVDSSGTLTLLESARIQAEGSQLITVGAGGRISSDGRYAFVSHGRIDPGVRVFSVFDLQNGISLVDQGAGDNLAAGGRDIAISADSSAVWHSHFAGRIHFKSFDGQTISGADKIIAADDSTACTSDGVFCVASDGFQGFLLRKDVAGIVLVSEFAPFGNVRPRSISISPDDKYVAVRSDLNNGDEARLEIYELLSTGLTLLDHGELAKGRESLRPHWSPDGKKIFMGDREFSWDGISLSLTNTFTGDFWVARTTDGSLIANLEQASLSIKDGTSFAEFSRTNLGGQISWFEFFPEIGPTTPEELFQASYADASAAPPKITALISPADVQRSIDTDVTNLVGGPDFYTVEAIFGIGELSSLRQDKLYLVKDDQPGLRDGKLLRLKRCQIRSGDPAVPVTCTFWG